jgi:hypothetical protein
MTTSNQTQHDTGRILPFVPRRKREATPPVEDVAKYARAGEDDYRLRMTNNVLAFVVCTLLVLAGVWLVNRIAEYRKTQDCVLSGRQGCTQVLVPTRER